jgi:hypothetical protein
MTKKTGLNALEQARLNAIELLGLHEGNTAQDRARAMGYDWDNPQYHMTDKNFDAFDPSKSKRGKLGPGVYSSPSGKYVNKYAKNEGDWRVIPMVGRGNYANVLQRGDALDSAVNSQESGRHDPTQWQRLATELMKKQGFAGHEVDEERVTYDPANLRSQYAAFNPSRMHENDLYAANGGGVSIDEMRHALSKRDHFAIGGRESRNWNSQSIQNSLDPVEKKIGVRGRSKQSYEEQKNYCEELIKDYESQPQDEELTQAINQLRNNLKNLHIDHALHNWVNGNLTNYIKKDFGREHDPVRALAEQGITHIDPKSIILRHAKNPFFHEAENSRQLFGGKQLGQSELAKRWEDIADSSVNGGLTVGHIIAEKEKAKSLGYRPLGYQAQPWMENVDPNTKIWKTASNMEYSHFERVIAALKKDMQEGNLRPEQLSKINIEQAVRRAYEHENDKQKQSLNLVKDMPVHSQFPDGYKWVELTKPQGTDDKEGKARLLAALKDEGKNMRHCVGGDPDDFEGSSEYQKDILNGRCRIYSLRDEKNEPHVTIEESIPPLYTEQMARYQLGPLINLARKRGGEKHEKEYIQEQLERFNRPSIQQIKGKGNKFPDDKYLPHVVSFLNSRKWSDVNDLDENKIESNEYGEHFIIPKSDGNYEYASGGRVALSLDKMKYELAKADYKGK